MTAYRSLGNVSSRERERRRKEGKKEEKVRRERQTEKDDLEKMTKETNQVKVHPDGFSREGRSSMCFLQHCHRKSALLVFSRLYMLFHETTGALPSDNNRIYVLQWNPFVFFVVPFLFFSSFRCYLRHHLFRPNPLDYRHHHHHPHPLPSLRPRHLETETRIRHSCSY